MIRWPEYRVHGFPAGFVGLVLTAMLFVLLFPCRVPGGERKQETGAPDGMRVASNVIVTAAFDEECEKAVIREIRKAEKEILVAIYSITRRNIVSALISASQTDVKIRVKYDAKQAEWEAMTEALANLRKQGIVCQAVKSDDEKSAMHNKFMVVDGRRVLTGSFNFTSSGVSNRENVVILESEILADSFREAFEEIPVSKRTR